MYIDKSGNKWYKVGLHIHTTISDGVASPEEAARIYREAGFDAIAITDHWKYHDDDIISDLKIISGCEYNLGSADSIEGVMHIVCVGTEKEPEIIKEKYNAQQIIDEINNNGGIAILAHPAWSLNTLDSVKHLTGFTATEIYNSVSDACQSSRPYSGYFIDALANTGTAYRLIATDDTHYYDGSDETKSYIMVNAKSNTTKDILEAIRQGNFYATQGPELYVRKQGNKIIVDCSECVKIDFLTNAVWESDKMLRGKNLTHAEHEIRDFIKWIRVEVLDDNGKYAWSNIMMCE